MSLHVDWQFAEDIAVCLPRFKRIGKKLNFRCHICGDSDKDAFKARGWFYEYEGKVRYGCFNCNNNFAIGQYLKEYHPDTFRKWLMEKRKESGSWESTSKQEEPKIEQFNKKLYVEDLPFCSRLDTLPVEHPIIKYVSQRKIPVEKYNLLWFTMDWRKLVNSVHADTYPGDSAEQKEPRLVIPIFNEQKKIESFQGRALRANSNNKYITIKAHENASKVYGLDRVVEGDVFFLEGPIDSLFIFNGAAITGGQLGLSEVPYEGRRVWVMDNERSHPDTIRRIETLINAGERVVLFDKCKYQSKDINDMIVKEGASIEEINEYLRNNIVQGLMAQLRFKKWRRI